MRWSSSVLRYILFLTLQSSITATNVVPRYLHSAVYDSQNDRILLMGGTTSSSNNTKDVYSLDLASAFERSAVNFTRLPSLMSAVSDATAVMDDTGAVHVIGGQQDVCSTKLTTQQYGAKNGSVWQTATSTGAVPGPRRGARAAFVNGEIQYFGGRSLANCSSSQYYYNTMYHVDTVSNNWTVSNAASPPVAEADMAMINVGSSSLLLIGGESVSSSAKASWVSMTQFAQYNSGSSTWSYSSGSNSGATISPRSGHTAVSNGSHTFIYGGALGAIPSTPRFLIMTEGDSSINITSANSTTESAAPPVSLYGHTAIMTKNGIMVILFGMQNTSMSAVYSDQVYLYDTVRNTWLDKFDPRTNANQHQSSKSRSTKNLSTGSLVAIILVSLSLSGALLFYLSSLLRKRRERARRLRSIPVNRLGTFTPNVDRDFDHASITGSMEKNLGVQLPTWAAMHAYRARSNSPPPDGSVRSSVSQMRLKSKVNKQDYDIQDVQFACPPAIRDLTFTAPRLQLRVVNPDNSSTRNSFDVATSMPEIVQTMQSGLVTTVPLTINNEDDLELLRARLSESPMVGNIDDQLAGLGLVIQESIVHETGTGRVHRVRTITRHNDPAPSSLIEPAHDYRGASDTNPTVSSKLGSLLVLDTNLSPMLPHDFSHYSPELSSYSPFLDSPRSSRAASPTGRASFSPYRSDLETSFRGTMRPSKRTASWSSNTSKTGLLMPWPTLSTPTQPRP